MRSLIVPAFLVLLGCSTPKGLDPARLPANDEMELDTIIHDDLNNDEIEDTVKLLPAPDKSDYHVLEISLSQKDSLLKIENKKLVYALSNPGASLENLDNGSFKVIIDHSGVGRSASLLMGEGERNSKAFKMKADRKELKNVNYDWLPKKCKF